MSTFKILHDMVAVLAFPFHLGFVITDSATFRAQMGFDVA